jgi:predicted metalloenzyme YecM
VISPKNSTLQERIPRHQFANRNSGKQALEATIDSGIRCIFALSHPIHFSRWDIETCQPEQDIIPEAQSQFIEVIAGQQPFGDWRVSVGFAFDYYFSA